MVSTRRTRSQTSDPSDTQGVSESTVSTSPRKTRSTRSRVSRASNKEIGDRVQSTCVTSDASQYTSPAKASRKVRPGRRLRQNHSAGLKAKDEVAHSESSLRGATSPIRIPLSSVAHEICPSSINGQRSPLPKESTSPVARPIIMTPSPKKCQQKFQSTPRIPVYRSPQFDAFQSFATVGRAPRATATQVVQSIAYTPIMRRHKMANEICELELSQDDLIHDSCPAPSDADTKPDMEKDADPNIATQPSQSIIVESVTPAHAAAGQKSSPEEIGNQHATNISNQRMTAQVADFNESMLRSDEQIDSNTAPASPIFHYTAPMSSTPPVPITPDLLQSTLLAIGSDPNKTPKRILQPHLAYAVTPTTTWIDGVEVPLPPDDWSPVKTDSSLLRLSTPRAGTIADRDDTVSIGSLRPSDEPVTEPGSDLCIDAISEKTSTIAVDTATPSPIAIVTFPPSSSAADISVTSEDISSPNVNIQGKPKSSKDLDDACVDVVDFDAASSSQTLRPTSTSIAINDITAPIDAAVSNNDESSSLRIAHQAAATENDAEANEQSFSYVIIDSDAYSGYHASGDNTDDILEEETMRTTAVEEERLYKEECVSPANVSMIVAADEAMSSESASWTVSPEAQQVSQTDVDTHGFSIAHEDESLDLVEAALPEIANNDEAMEEENPSPTSTAELRYDSIEGGEPTLQDVLVCDEVLQDDVRLPDEGPDHVSDTNAIDGDDPVALDAAMPFSPAPVFLADPGPEMSRESLDGAMDLSFIERDYKKVSGNHRPSVTSSAQNSPERTFSSNNRPDKLKQSIAVEECETVAEVSHAAGVTSTEADLHVHTPELEPLTEELEQASLNDQSSTPTMDTEIVKKPKKSSSRRQSRRQSYMTATKTAVRERELEMLNAQDARDAADLQFAADLEAAESLLQEMPGSVERRRTRSRTSSISKRSPPAQPKEFVAAIIRETDAAAATTAAAAATTMSPVVLNSYNDIQPGFVASEAAIKIQALFRGWRARKCLDEQNKGAPRSSEVKTTEQSQVLVSDTKTLSNSQAPNQLHSSDKASNKEHDINDVFSDFLSKWQSKKSLKVKNEEPVVVLAESPVKTTAPATPRRIPAGTLSPSKSTAKTMVAIVPSSAQKGRDAVANSKEARSRLPGPKSGVHGSSIPFLKSSTRNLEGRRTLSSQSTRSTGSHTTSPFKTAAISASASIPEEAPRKRKATSEVLSHPNPKKTRALQEPAIINGTTRPLLTESTSDLNLGLARSKTPPASTLSTKSAPVTPKRLLYLTPAEVTKTTRNFTSHNRLYRCDFDRVVIRKEIPRPPSPTAKLQARMAMNARSKRKKLMKEKGYTFGAGDDEDYVPKNITPERRAVKWQENLEIDLQTLPRTSPSKVRGVEEVQPCIGPAQLDDYGNLGDGPPLTPELGKAPKVIITKYLYRGEQDD